MIRQVDTARGSAELHETTKHGFVAKMALEKSFGFFQHQLWTLPGRMMKSLFWSYALRRSGSDKTWRATRRVLGNKLQVQTWKTSSRTS